MKVKITMFILLIILFIFLIYASNKDNKIYYVNIDATNNMNYNRKIYKTLKRTKKLEKYINSFSKKDLRTTDLIYDIQTNKKIKNQTIQNALIKADILTLNIGVNDINYKIGHTSDTELYKYTDEVLKDIEKLFKLLRIYTKEKIYVIGYYNNNGVNYDDYFLYTNSRLKKISKKYNIEYVDPKKNIYNLVIKNEYLLIK